MQALISTIPQLVLHKNEAQRPVQKKKYKKSTDYCQVKIKAICKINVTVWQRVNIMACSLNFFLETTVCNNMI